MYTTVDAAVMYMDARSYGLSGSELLSDPKLVMRDCNGVGADWMPQVMRDLATALSPCMEIPAAIHDRRYAIGGEAPGRLFADGEFLTNCLAMIERKYGWLNPLRYLMFHRANRYYTLLRTFGAIAYGKGNVGANSRTA